MVKRKKKWRLWLPALIAFAISGAVLERAAGAQNGAAQEPGAFRSENLQMLVKAGYGGLEVNYMSGNWAPFRITLENHGRPITGSLVVRAEASSNPNPTYREFVKDIQLPTGSRQFHEIAAYVQRGEDPVVRLVSGDEVIAETSVHVERSYYNSDRLEIAVVDADSTALNNIASAPIARPTNRQPFKNPANSAPVQAQQSAANPALQATPPLPPNVPPPPPGRRGRGWPGSGQQNLTARPIVIPPEELPRDYVSYDPLDAVVLGDAPLSQLTEDQARALKLWVAAGGFLVVTGGADIAGLRANKLDALLPVDAYGAVTSPALPELVDTYGPFETDDPLLVMSGRLRPEARMLLGSDRQVIAAEKNYGSGAVRFVAFNPKLNPYRGWAAAKDLWNDLLLPAAEMKPKRSRWINAGGGRNSSPGSMGVQGFLFHLAEIEPPSARYFLLFLLCYVLAVGPLNYLALRWLKKLDMAWLTIPSVVILFTVVSVTVAQLSRGGKSIASDIALVELHQREGLARVLGGMLLMPASKGTHELAFQGRDTFVHDVESGPNASSASASDILQAERSPQGVNLRVPLNTWTSSVYEVRLIEEGARPLVQAAPEANAPRTSVRNLGGAPITKAVYISAAGIS
ncbi:MAG TPA: hypothetical protein VNO70_07285, partial [Blastocatellia bacterium]|nr:hypothetical protein [Blastocatellia bacterium]